MRKFEGSALLGPLFLLAVVWAYLISRLQYQFGGYDLSPLIDAGWRVNSGQIPNKDFICTFPPLLYLGAAAAFRLFGLHWMALSFISALFTTGITLLGLRTLYLLREELLPSTRVGLAYTFTLLQLLPALVIGHPWHSSWSESVAMYALLATFALAYTSRLARSAPPELLLHLALAEMLLLLAKPNTAAPTLLVCIAALLLCPRRLRNLILPLAGAVAVASILLLTVHTNLLTTYHLYSALSARLSTDSRFDELFGNPFVPGGLPDFAIYLAVLPTLIWTLVIALRSLRSRNQLWLSCLALGSIAIAILSLGTNVEFRLVDLSCIMLGAALLATGLPHPSSRWLQGAFAQSLFTLLLLGVFEAQIRARMVAVGPFARAECSATLTERHDPFFGPFHACAPFFSLLSQVDSVHAQYPRARVFFGPRMEFLYARDGIASPKGLPLWWHPGSSFPELALPRIVQAWEQSDFDLLVFLHDGRTRMPGAILDFIQQHYIAVPLPAPPGISPDGQIDVYRRR